MLRHEVILTDLDGVVISEIVDADERKLSLPHMRMATASIKIPLWHPYADTVLNEDCMIKWYRTDPWTNDRELLFNGPVVTAEENGEALGQSIAVTASSPLWRLSRRLIPGTLSKTGIGYGSEATPDDLGYIAHLILADVNGPSFTGLSAGTRVDAGDGWVTYKQIKNAAEAITELAAGMNSFEFQIEPTEPTNVAGSEGWPQIGKLNIAPSFGQTRDDAIFEYGTGEQANVASYTRSLSREGLLTRAIVSLSGWPDGTTQDLRILTDATARANRGLFEEVVPDNGVIDDTIRDALGQFHVDIRKNPRQIVTFKPVMNTRPSPMVDYRVGDTIRGLAMVRGSLRFDSLFRIWGISFEVDKNGNESVELELVKP